MRDFVVGDWTADPDRNKIMRGDTERRLEPRVMDLLVYFSERPGEVLSADQIIGDVWPHAFVTNGALLTALSALRKALGDSPRKPAYLETIPKRGYRLIARSSAGSPSLAVLPIASSGSDPAHALLADGLTDGLIADLGRIPALTVISRSSVMTCRDDEGPQQIGRRLGARLVLSGAMTAGTKGLSLSVRLTDVNGNAAILERTFEPGHGKLPALQHDVARAVAVAIRDRLRSVPAGPGTSTAGSHRPHPDAVIEYLRGRFHWYRQSPERFDRAREHFERAVEIDPGYAPAYVGIADLWGAYGYWGSRSGCEVRRPTFAAIERAMEIDPDSPDALAVLAARQMYFEHDWPAAEAALRRAISINRNLCHSRLIYALFLGMMKRPQAIDEIDHALRIDPLNPAVLLVRGLIDSASGRLKAAMGDVDELLALDPTHPPGLQLQADLHWCRGSPDALGYERLVWGVDETVAGILSREYRTPRAALGAAADTLIARAARRYVAPYEIVRLLCHAGRTDDALEHLRSAIADDDFMRLDFLQLSPAFAALREHGAYPDLARSVGMPA